MARTLKQLRSRKVGLEVELAKCNAEIAALTGEDVKTPKKAPASPRGRADRAPSASPRDGDH